MGPRGSGSQKVVAATPQNVGVLQVGVSESADRRRLADAGLAAHQHRPTVAVRGGGEELLQTLENVVSLQQLHKSNDGTGRAVWLL